MNEDQSLDSALTFLGYALPKQDISNDLLEEIRSLLLVKPFVNPDYQFNEKPYAVYRQSEKKIYIPKFFGIEKFGSPARTVLGEGEQISLQFPGLLRDEQTFVVEKAKKAYEDKGGGVISLYCGGGKTTIALKLISLLSRKTLVIVHSEFLMEQWIERTKQFLPDAKIGIIQKDSCEIDNNDIVIGMIQSITKRNYSKDQLKTFGHLIIDECHHIACEVFSSLFYKIQCKYMLGLSATPTRKDGLSKVIYWFLGPIIINIKRQDNKPLIRTISSDASEFTEKYNRAMKPNIPEMIGDIVNNYSRNIIILDQIEKCVNDNRKILILTERVNHCNYLNDTLNKRDISNGKYIGKMKTIDREISCKKQVIIGTYKMAAEGFDCPDLDTLILASPKSDIEQSVGRILRKRNKNYPLVIDIIDSFSIFTSQSKKRKKFYKKNNYEYEFEDSLTDDNTNTNNNTNGDNNVKLLQTKIDKSLFIN